MDEGTKAINKKDEERAKFLAMLEEDEVQSTTVHGEYSWVRHLNYLYEENMARPSNQLAFFALSLCCMAFCTGTAFYSCGGNGNSCVVKFSFVSLSTQGIII